MMIRSREKKLKTSVGPLQQKILLLLFGGIALGLTRSPRQYFRIARAIGKEWRWINRQQLNKSIRALYESKLVDWKEFKDGTIKLVLSEEGKERALVYNLDTMKIKKPARWDGLWRIVTFDIPEKQRRARDALRDQLKHLNFFEYQKSVFVLPYECKDEVDFVIECFEIRKYVRYIVAKSLDNELHLKREFKLP